MKKLLSSFVVIATSIFAQEKPQKFQEMFYVTMGSEIPMTKNHTYSKYQRSLESIGMGIRTFFLPEHGMDVCATLYFHPNVRMAELSIGYVYKPEILYGIYLGASGYSRNELTSWLDKFYRVGYRGFLGYQVPIKYEKSAFLEIGMDEKKDLNIKSGLMF